MYAGNDHLLRVGPFIIVRRYNYDFHPNHTATGQRGQETLEISEFLRSLLRSDAQAGPTGRCPPDGYDGIVDARFAMQ
jgi:hypothetical protein